MPAPARQRLKNEKYAKNINKRGNVKMKDPREGGSRVGPILLAFFLFVVVGSAKRGGRPECSRTTSSASNCT